MVVITSLLWCPGGSALTGLWEYAADSHGPRCPAALLPRSAAGKSWTAAAAAAAEALWHSTAETRRFKGNHDNTNQINCLAHQLRHRRDSKKKVAYTV